MLTQIACMYPGYCACFIVLFTRLQTRLIHLRLQRRRYRTGMHRYADSLVMPSGNRRTGSLTYFVADWVGRVAAFKTETNSLIISGCINCVSWGNPHPSDVTWLYPYITTVPARVYVCGRVSTCICTNDFKTIQHLILIVYIHIIYSIDMTGKWSGAT